MLWKADEKRNRMAGTGEPELTSGAVTDAQKDQMAVTARIDTLSAINQKVKPEFLTAKSDIKSFLGDKLEYTNAEWDTWAKESAAKEEWQGDVMGYVNQLIKDR